MRKLILISMLLTSVAGSQQSFANNLASPPPTSPEALQGILGSAFKANNGSTMVAKTRRQMQTLTQGEPVGIDSMGALPKPSVATKAPQASAPTTVVMHGSPSGNAAWLLPEMKKNQTADTLPEASMRPYQSVSLKATYAIGGLNKISDTDGNALLSPVPIAHVAPEPNSIKVVKWIDNTKGEHIGFVFNVINPQLTTLQMMVILKGSHPAVSLVFQVRHVHGRVFSLPSSLVGNAPLVTSPIFGEPSAYDSQVIQIMQQVLSHQSLGNTWQYSVRYHPASPYREFRVKRHQRWFNDAYRIDAFNLCSRYNGTLYLRANTFAASNTIAVTLTKNSVNLGECTRLVVLGSNQHHSQSMTTQNNAAFGPGQEMHHA